MSKTLSAIGLVGIGLAATGYLQVSRIQAAGPAGAKRDAAAPQTQAAAPAPPPAVGAPSRAVLEQYCVTCHNEKLKTGNLMLDKVDMGDVTHNQELLEKI